MDEDKETDALSQLLNHFLHIKSNVKGAFKYSIFIFCKNEVHQ